MVVCEELRQECTKDERSASRLTDFAPDDLLFSVDDYDRLLEELADLENRAREIAANSQACIFVSPSPIKVYASRVSKTLMPRVPKLDAQELS